MGQQQQSGGADNSLAPVWITVLSIIALFFIWKMGHEYIVSFVFYLNIMQAKLMNLVVNDVNLTNNIYLMETLDPKSVDWNQLVAITREVGNYIRYPIIGLFLILAIVLFRSDVTLRFRKTHNMSSLSAQEQKNWPAIMPVLKKDLLDIDINTGPWAMAMTPLEFGRKYNLLKKNDLLLDNQLPGLEMTAGLRRGDAKRVFTLQLGPAWDGFNRCQPHVRALAAIFMARMHRDKDTAAKILSALDKGYSTGKPDFSLSDSVLEKYKNSESVQEIISKHAYMLTVMASLLEAARLDGVVPSAEFLWLKPVDRRLWYMLNCIGRQTPYSEVGGPFAHWRAEKAMGRGSLAPMIDEAIKALEIAIREVKLKPKELQELKP